MKTNKRGIVVIAVAVLLVLWIFEPALLGHLLAITIVISFIVLAWTGIIYFLRHM